MNKGKPGPGGRILPFKLLRKALGSVPTFAEASFFAPGFEGNQGQRPLKEFQVPGESPPPNLPPQGGGIKTWGAYLAL